MLETQIICALMYWQDVVSMKQRLNIIHYNIALWKRAFWLAKTLDPFARGLHAHISLYIFNVSGAQVLAVLALVNKGQNERKKRTSTKQKQTKCKCRSVVSRSTRFRKWRIRRWRIIRACSENFLSCNIAFFYFLCSNYFCFLTDCCWYIRRWSRTELLRFLERFMTTKWIGF